MTATTGAALAAAVLLAGIGPGGQAVLPALALVSLMATPLRDLGLAWEMRQSYRVAAAKVSDLLQAPADPPFDSDSHRTPPRLAVLPPYPTPLSRRIPS